MIVNLTQALVNRYLISAGLSVQQQELVDEGLVEKKRGRGMFVTDGARTQLLKDERKRFLGKEWPVVAATIKRLGLNTAELLSEIEETSSSAESKEEMKGD